MAPRSRPAAPDGWEKLPPEVRESASLFVTHLAGLLSATAWHRSCLLEAALDAATEAAAAAEDVGRRVPVEGARSLPAHVGVNVRRLRGRAAWTQDQLAQTMSGLGFDWKRVTVAEVERGARRTSLEELLGLAEILSESVALLMSPTDGGNVEMPAQRVMGADAARKLVTGRS